MPGPNRLDLSGAYRGHRTSACTNVQMGHEAARCPFDGSVVSLTAVNDHQEAMRCMGRQPRHLSIGLLSDTCVGNRMQPMPTPQIRIRGSLIVFRRTCGKPGCRCAGRRGIPHASPALKCSVDGVSRLITLAPDDVPWVRAALVRYQQDQRRLDRACAAGLRRLDARRAARRAKRAS